MNDRRQDRTTAALILEALHMKRAFDEDAALKLLHRKKVPEDLARSALVGPFERRQVFRRQTIRLLGELGRLPRRDLN
ncbi:hypothetical protein [Massilia pseudoviolaceinigra]|uniref:hypothetical protein n=1 Tax=Massilia pseudoviolaceinigra TaxID=3057165 RepID=UPI002796B9B2|nr:hypothetical protein [Massilia sp. CCM 9206]MDQ1920565.1 hypothetical protein [Massilia sp. CCM 9206]